MLAKEEDSMSTATPKPHFLIVTYPAHGHINPARHLARRLLLRYGATVTIATAVSAYRKMFPDAVDKHEHLDGATGIRYAHYSDGYDDGFSWAAAQSRNDYMIRARAVGSRTLGGVLARLRDAGHPATLLVYTLALSWAADVARSHSTPAALYWIQPITVLAAYLHYFLGTDGVDKTIAAAAQTTAGPWTTVRVPGLLPLCLRDLPSLMTIAPDDDDHPDASVLAAYRELADVLLREGHHHTVLANTFDAMEPEAVASLRQLNLDVMTIGPVLSFLDGATASEQNAPKPQSGGDLFQEDGKDYLKWLDDQPAASVVYIAFGGLSVMSRRQIVEITRGLEESGRPFLWVLRKDNRGEEYSVDAAAHGCERGLVVEWCDQVRVLSNRAVGCFITHCGWNSTLESVASGVPVVGMPQWGEQATNAWLVEQQLGSGVRAAVSEDGVLEAVELQRCIDIATSGTMRAKATFWCEKARDAVAEGGSSQKNLRGIEFQMGQHDWRHEARH
ncbi:unnamed protein product [Urochloa decumbens]|uniref:Glycosyltransferase n=1 Tax=Urochloa decumbens TaxID=240449 RepID=A0ABC9B4T4_9POAL